MVTNLTLIRWYNEYGRDLPWRYNSSDYEIWLSEIILQQTRVAQGLNYFKKFKAAYPTVHHLARAPLDEVLKLWQGLGYYTRARNLHVTAKFVSEEYNGVFPNTYEGLLKLKGIGSYTAAAIASISHKIPVAVVDGNVLRVLSRLFGIFTPIDSSVGKKEFAALAQELVDKQHPDIYNQAIMDFGAMVCTPKKAQCNDCPFNDKCYAFLNNFVSELPVKSRKTKIRNRYFYYILIHYDGDNIFMRQRKENDIWQLLYEFPLIESEAELSIDEVMQTNDWKDIIGNQQPIINNISEVVKHQLSHQTIWCRFYNITLESASERLFSEYQKININDVKHVSVSRLIENYIINNKDKNK